MASTVLTRQAGDAHNIDPGSNLMSKNSTLHQSELDALLAWLAPRRDQAGEKYESIRQMLTRYFEWRHCMPADEHVDETIDRVARRVGSGEQIRAANPYRYFHGVAKHVCLESLRHKPREVHPRHRFIAIREAASPRLACLETCLCGLTPEARELLITPNAMRLRVFRERRKLKSCVMRCLSIREQ
jgi:hypothetical protein